MLALNFYLLGKLALWHLLDLYNSCLLLSNPFVSLLIYNHRQFLAPLSLPKLSLVCQYHVDLLHFMLFPSSNLILHNRSYLFLLLLLKLSTKFSHLFVEAFCLSIQLLPLFLISAAPLQLNLSLSFLNQPRSSKWIVLEYFLTLSLDSDWKCSFHFIDLTSQLMLSFYMKAILCYLLIKLGLNV